MFHATLIVGGNLEQRLKRASQLAEVKLSPATDILVVEPEKSIGIKKVRELEKFLSRKPLNLDQKIGFIPLAETLTLAAQNAILKTLEEPPPNSLIILTSPTLAKLIPTIVSRCQVVKLKNQPALSKKIQVVQAKLFADISSATMGERIELIKPYANNKQSAIDFSLGQLQFLHSRLNAQTTKKEQRLMQRLTETIKYLEANVNPKLSLEQLVFDYPTSKAR